MDNSDKSVSKVGYRETKDKLQIRIDAHKNFSNFSLEDWIKSNVSVHSGCCILDIGCGSGNMFETYAEMSGESGVVVGIDQSEELLAKANSSELNCSRILMKYDMNNRMPFVEQSFDLVISTFAIYYIDDVDFILEETARVLKDGGTFALVGPSSKNAEELYMFNKDIFGFEMNPKVLKRTERLEKEFLPKAKEKFGDVTFEKIDSKINFPDKDSFLEYYLATLLFQESCEKSGTTPTYDELYSKLQTTQISKEMVALCGKK